ncbi:MAG: ABC transporter substrate binding protein [Methyloligellaceae bacterium]
MRRFLTGFALFLFVGCYAVSLQAAEVLVVTWAGKFPSEVAFEKRLKELKPGVKFRYIDAERNKSVLAKKLRELDLNSVDLVYTFGTTGAKIVKQYLNGKKPHVFNVVSAPVLSRVATSIEKPGNNITGARLLSDLNEQFEILGKLRDYKSIAIWFDPREKQNGVLLPQIKKIVKKKGASISLFRMVPGQDGFDAFLKDASTKTNKLDALYIIGGASFHKLQKKLHEHLEPSLLVMGVTKPFVAGGSTIALGASLVERGQAVAEQANKILGGTAAGDIPVSLVTKKNAILFVNKAKMASAGLKGLDTLGVKVEYVEGK